MKRVMVVSVLVAGMSVWSPVYADSKHSSGQPEHPSTRYHQRLLDQLPAEKETLFHRTMREVQERRVAIREEVVKARAEVRDVLVAPEFDEALFQEKTARVRELLGQERRVVGDAIAALAKQYTPEERKVLAELMSKSKHHRRWSSHHQLL